MRTQQRRLGKHPGTLVLSGVSASRVRRERGRRCARSKIRVIFFRRLLETTQDLPRRGSDGRGSRNQKCGSAAFRRPLYRACDLSRLAFASTAELDPIDGMIGQARALEAVEFGTKIDKAGFNLFVIGGTGVGMRDAVKAMLAEEARTRPGLPIGSMSTISSSPTGRSRSSSPQGARPASRTRCTSSSRT